mmetsp:Transcript_31300/g.65315  ORF Transcript_31300/g.65315 Transcript_31300/m.65315 type:complete len:83 (+) Transcript_31300:995-1243(+)
MAASIGRRILTCSISADQIFSTSPGSRVDILILRKTPETMLFCQIIRLASVRKATLVFGRGCRSQTRLVVERVIIPRESAHS